jgi:hypothetical protein
VVVVERMIMPETFHPTDCLSTANQAAKCAVPVPLGTSSTDALTIAMAARDPQVDTVDLNPAFCPTAPMCQPVVDGEIVWRDDHHVTARFAEARWRQVWRQIRRTEAFADEG